jgi:hypothetical protein
MNNFSPESDLDIISRNCNDDQKKGSRKDTQENVPVLDQERNKKIESIKVDKAQDKIQRSICPEIIVGLIDIPGIQKLVNHVKPIDDMDQNFDSSFHFNNLFSFIQRKNFTKVLIIQAEVKGFCPIIYWIQGLSDITVKISGVFRPYRILFLNFRR